MNRLCILTCVITRTFWREHTVVQNGRGFDESSNNNYRLARYTHSPLLFNVLISRRSVKSSKFTEASCKWYSILYLNFCLPHLIIKFIERRNIYCSMHLVNDSSDQVTTTTINDTVNPAWEQSFTLYVFIAWN